MHPQELDGLCEQLVLARELHERNSLEAVHEEVSLALEAVSSQSAALQLQARPAEFGIALAQSVSGATYTTHGFSPVHDLVLQAAQPMALTPAGVQQGFAQAAQLAEEVKVRKRRTLAALMGRVQLRPGEADAILAGPPAARVLDFLLEQPSAAERAGSLGDCFTPPEESSCDDEGVEELLWCTPMQLLAEVERRLACTSHPAVQEQQQPGTLQPLLLQGPGMQLQQEDLGHALRQLQAEIREHWLYSSPSSRQ